MNDEVQTEQAEPVNGENVVGTGNDARLALLNQINDTNDEMRGDELEDINDDGTTAPFVVKTAEGEEQQLTDESVTEPINQEGFTTQPVKHKIKINGVEKELSTEELIARAQKIEAADQYLAEAARLRQQAQQEVQQKSQPSAPDAAKQDEDDLALARALQMGDEAEAVAAIRKIRESAAPRVLPVNPDDLSRTIDERLTFNEAIGKFRDEYKDLVSDPHLNKMVLDLDAQMIASGDKRPYAERYKDVGEQVRGWVNKFKTPVAETQMQDKLARKAAVVAPPKAAGGKVASTIVEEKEESTSDTIAAIAKARGGAQWMNGMTR